MYTEENPRTNFASTLIVTVLYYKSPTICSFKS